MDSDGGRAQEGLRSEACSMVGLAPAFGSCWDLLELVGSPSNYDCAMSMGLGHSHRKGLRHNSVLTAEGVVV